MTIQVGSPGSSASISQLSALKVAMNGEMVDEPSNAHEWWAGLTPQGVNFGNQFNTPKNAYQGPWVREQEMIRAAAAGIDWCRIPVRLAAWATEDTAGVIDPALWAILDPFVTLALKYFKRVEVENFDYRWLSSQAVEAPETVWSTNADDHRLRNKNMVIQMAQHYRDWSLRLALGPYNEPIYPHYDDGIYWAFVADVATAVRAQGGNNVTRTLMGCTTGQGNVAKLLNVPVITDPNTIVQAHPYHPFAYTHQGAWGSSVTANTWQFGDWVISAIDASIRTMSLWSKNTGIPVVVGEMGVYWKNIFQGNPTVNNPVGRARYYKAAREACERYGVPLAFWSWGSDFGVTDSTDDESSRSFLVGMQSAVTGFPKPASTTPLPRSLAYVENSGKFVAALANGATFDPIQQEVIYPTGGASWGSHLALCDGKPVAGTTYQLVNGGVGGNGLILSWVNDFNDIAGTRGSNSTACRPGELVEYTIPVETTVGNNARFVLDFVNDNVNYGSIRPHVTIKGL